MVMAVMLPPVIISHPTKTLMRKCGYKKAKNPER
jgi:hypothetical protein